MLLPRLQHRQAKIHSYRMDLDDEVSFVSLVRECWLGARWGQFGMVVAGLLLFGSAGGVDINGRRPCRLECQGAF